MPKELLICGPAGTGKTYGVLSILHCLARDYPGMRILFVRATRASLTESVLVTFEQKVLPADGYAWLAEGQQRSHRQSYKYPNGSEIVLAGLDRSPTRVLSTEWDIVFCNESTELQATVWETISSRLDRPGRASRFGWLWGDTNPDGPQHWLKRRADSGKTTLWTTVHEANPLLFDGLRWTPAGLKYLHRLDALTGVRYLRLRKGLWAGAEGLVYDQYDPAVHDLTRDQLPKGWRDWRRIRAVDFGFTNPFVCGWWLIDGDGRMYLDRELYGTKRLVSDWAKLVVRHTGDETIEATPADWDAEDRATMEAGDVRTTPAFKGVKEGIEAVQLRLRKADDGRPRIYFLDDSLIERDPELVDARKPTRTTEEFAGYVWLPPQPGKPPKEEPRKVDDHGMDMMRYGVAQIDGMGTYSAGAY